MKRVLFAICFNRILLFTLSPLLLLSFLSACLPESTVQTSFPTEAPPTTQVPHNPTSGTPKPATSTPLPNFTSSPTPTELQITQLPITNTPISDLQSPNFPLTLPISLPLTASIPIDPSYRFASTQGGNREPHHGVEFLLPFGSPVLAAADGTVFFAGNDNNGSPYTRPKNYAFYGNFVILEHNIQYPIPNHQSPITLYTLYAHLSQLNVQTGDTVHAGDKIGLIGFSGAALGPHLHFEVRLNGTTYADCYNPELFLNQPDRGVLVGRILDANGELIPPTPLTITRLTPDTGQPRNLYITTYEDNALALRPPFNENFSLSLPPGQYEIAFVMYGVHTQIIEIHPGEFTFFEMTVGNE